MSWRKTIQPEAKSSWRDSIQEDSEDLPTKVAPTELESFGRGAVQTASMGFRDEAAGALESPMGALKKTANLFGADFSDEDVARYEAEVEESRRLDREAEAANPKSYLGGQVVGGVASAAIPGGGLTRLAAEGAALGIGSSEADNAGGIARDAAIGGATGYGIGKVGQAAAPYLQKGAQKVGQFLGKAADPLKAVAETQSAKAQGVGVKEFKDIDAARRIGRFGLDKEVVTAFASDKTMLARARALKEAGGETMNKVYSQIDEAGASTFNPLDTAVRVEQELAPTYRTPINKGEVNQLENTLESILQRGDGQISMAEAQALKKEIGAVAYPRGRAPVDPTPKQQMAMDAYGVINKSIDDAAEAGAEKIGVEGLKETLQSGKNQFRYGKKIEDLLTNKVAKDEAKGFIGGILDTAQIVAAPFTGGASLGTLAAQKGLQFAGKRANQVMAVTADNLAKMATQAPQKLGKFAVPLQKAAERGSQAVAATHFVLQQSDPEYRQKIKEIESNDEQESE